MVTKDDRAFENWFLSQNPEVTCGEKWQQASWQQAAWLASKEYYNPDSTFRQHPDGYIMYHSADGYKAPASVLVRIETGNDTGKLLHFSYDEWVSFPRVKAPKE